MKDPATGKTVLGQKAGDSGGFGNDKFGITYGWDASWQVSGFTGWGQPCNAQAKSLASLDRHELSANDLSRLAQVVLAGGLDDLARASASGWARGCP